MNDWTALHLRKWTPRRPSPDLHHRIFSQPHPLRKTAPGETFPLGPLVWLGDFSRWLVPALGCFLLVLASFSGRGALHERVSLVGTNLVFPADHSDINAVPKQRMEWNLASASNVSIHPAATTILFSYTNKLIQ